MSEKQRYTRQTSLPKFGANGQAKLAGGRVLIVGLGGLGIPVANYLNSMGVGTIGLVEQDIVELHNLQRQVLYSEKDVGKPKIEVALEKLTSQNSETDFIVFDTFLTKENALEIIKDFDVVVDATDNFPTRYLINDACIILNKPFVYGALHGFEGQVSVFNLKKGPTYRCLFPKQPSATEIPNCDENGVLGVIPGIVGTLQALEVIKVLTEVGEALSGKLLLFDGLTQTTQKISFPSNTENKKITELKDSYRSDGCSISNTITAKEFMALFEKEQIQVIDVRSAREFESFHLKDAKNIPIAELEERQKEIGFDRSVYLLCQSGKRSESAFKLLENLNPTAKLFNVAGGLNQISAHANAT